MTPLRELQARLARGVPPEWRAAFLAVPRHEFIPETVWIREEGKPVPVRRSDSPEKWLAVCYTDEPIAVQLDDGDGSGRGYVSSSASMPGVVALMLEAAELSPGVRVLEIGTGTGFNAALVATRVGAENVTTVEIDPGLAVAARTALTSAGWPVEVVIGDGTTGYAANAPYDRILSTAAVHAVPRPWIEQTAPGGKVVTPWATAFHSGALLRLRVADDGTASGRFDGDAGFMWVRGQRTPHGSVEDRVRPEHDFTETVTGLHPYGPVGDFSASFAIGLRVPGMTSTLVHDDDDPATRRYTVYLMDPGSGSWASWRILPEGAKNPEYPEYTVRQHGPRRLFDELDRAHRWWREAGSPEYTRFGLTTTPEGQSVWLDDPANVVA
ncbi:methyltransferase domain-containing protein [Streptomonospora sp. S1-112]|uniref:Protein-L-isoaspartate O-methyltransferase n=1 Tax=Streptomonospora mangrovi TaxID=2883123 RepID=A0A9X3NVK8_9ACTN|nr:methyltransferase domain-containing protein [Streptomonospora mangrovi]MDA0567710.1 methyltransferase domain-containing protein [Streptomonospora mangrovi]